MVPGGCGEGGVPRFVVLVQVTEVLTLIPPRRDRLGAQGRVLREKKGINGVCKVRSVSPILPSLLQKVTRNKVLDS